MILVSPACDSTRLTLPIGVWSTLVASLLTVSTRITLKYCKPRSLIYTSFPHFDHMWFLGTARRTVCTRSVLHIILVPPCLCCRNLRVCRRPGESRVYIDDDGIVVLVRRLALAPTTRPGRPTVQSRSLESHACLCRAVEAVAGVVATPTLVATLASLAPSPSSSVSTISICAWR